MERDEADHVVALKRAIEIAGGQSSLANGMTKFLSRVEPKRVSQQLISYWVNRKTLLEAVYWPAIEHVTANQVTRRELRPDVFGSGQAA